jgi:hypothetical protein
MNNLRSNWPLVISDQSQKLGRNLRVLTLAQKKVSFGKLHRTLKTHTS